MKLLILPIYYKCCKFFVRFFGYYFLHSVHYFVKVKEKKMYIAVFFDHIKTLKNHHCSKLVYQILPCILLVTSKNKEELRKDGIKRGMMDECCANAKNRFTNNCGIYLSTLTLWENLQCLIKVITVYLRQGGIKIATVCLSVRSPVRFLAGLRWYHLSDYSEKN